MLLLADDEVLKELGIPALAKHTIRAEIQKSNEI